MHEGSRDWALLAAARPPKIPPTIEGILAFGILWLDWTRGHADRRAIEGLRFFVPQGPAGRLRERAACAFLIRARRNFRIQRAGLAHAKNRSGGRWEPGKLAGAAPRQIESTAARRERDATRIRAMLPRHADAIRTARSAGANEVAFSFQRTGIRALDARGSIFRPGEFHRALTTANEPHSRASIASAGSASQPSGHRYESLHSIAPRPSAGWKPSSSKIPSKLDAQLDARHFSIRRFRRSRPVIAACSIFSASRAAAAWW